MKKSKLNFSVRVIPDADPIDLSRDFPIIRLSIADELAVELLDAKPHPRGGYSLCFKCSTALQPRILECLVASGFRPVF